ncbi:MAG TPA: sigma-70 family RNA polymerase sigma factor [Pirellulales bacterium]|nr:sigma-70 family RNA polymerase sigma factor [Pirellulales bacterium]
MPRSQEPDTEELLARAKTGDERAGIEAIARQRERLKSMLALRMDKRLKARLDPSDVIQESMIVASQRLGEFFRQQNVSFYVWLRSLTFERLIDMQRAHLYAKRRSVSREERSVLSLPDESVAELASRLVDVAGDPRAGMVRDELRTRVRAALDRLSPDEREVLVLRHLEDLSVAETAGALGIKESAVKMRALRALQKLREVLEEGG